MTTLKVGVLGEEGVTGQSVMRCLSRLDGFEHVRPADADIIVASPGIPPDQYPTVDVPIVSEIEFAYRLFHRRDSVFCPKIIGVTGTNGKSTVTELLGHLLGIPCVGNIGIPLIDFVDIVSGVEWLVVELSSFQLYGCSCFRPDVAVILNLVSDHLNWHRSFENYADAKMCIFKQQMFRDVLLFNEEDTLVSDHVAHAVSKTVGFSLDDLKQFPAFNTGLLGGHNQLNIIAALQTVEHVGVSVSDVLDRVSSFSGLQHRLEKVMVYRERTFYNDSKATNPDSTLKAIQVFTESVHLILCGDDKGLPLTDFICQVQNQVKSITVFGALSKRIVSECHALNQDFVVNRVETIDAAVRASFEQSSPQDVILFSPSSSSFDQFDNYCMRGHAFGESVKVMAYEQKEA